ncbi:MAG: hypothetical protein HY225_02695 [Candidatus Vogelbacteria bacterium]|nr:hypothetical protein [Candidatus Vogelbacteria bacterium]
MAYQGNRISGPREFRFGYNERTGFGTYTRLEGVGLVMICASQTKEQVEQKVWKVKALDGFKAGEVQEAEEKDFVRLDTTKNELEKCRKLAGQPEPERRDFQQSGRPVDFKQSQVGGRPQYDRPSLRYLYINNAPYGIKAKLVQYENGRVELQTSHDDAGTLSLVTPQIKYNQDGGDRNKRDESTGRVVRSWSYFNYDIVWVDREGKEVVVGKDADDASECSLE